MTISAGSRNAYMYRLFTAPDPPTVRNCYVFIASLSEGQYISVYVVHFRKNKATGGLY